MSTTTASIPHRSTSSTKPPPPPLTQHPTSSLHPSCTLTGTHPINLAAQCKIHLRTTLTTTHAPLTIHEGALISERCSLGFLSPPPKEEEKTEQQQEVASTGTIINRNVLIHPGCVIEAASIGAYAVIGAGARLGKGCVVGDGAKVCPGEVVPAGAVVGVGGVVWGGGERRVDGEIVRIGGGGVGGRAEGVRALRGGGG